MNQVAVEHKQAGAGRPQLAAVGFNDNLGDLRFAHLDYNPVEYFQPRNAPYTCGFQNRGEKSVPRLYISGGHLPFPTKV